MDYKDKLITVQEAISLVKSNDYIVTGLGAAGAVLFQSHLGYLYTWTKQEMHLSLLGVNRYGLRCRRCRRW